MSEYGLQHYGEMLADEERCRAYRKALRRTVGPSTRVLEIGTGPGLFALWALRLGARSVTGVEPDDVIEIARRLADGEPRRDRLRLVQGRSTDLPSGERFDLVVSDLRGVLPIHPGHLEAIRDARSRLLAPGGQLVPAADRLRVGLVESETAHRRHFRGFSDNGFGIDTSAARELLAHRIGRTRVGAGELLDEPADWCTFDYATADSFDATGTCTFRAARPGVAHGFAVWFESDLCAGVVLSTAPGLSATVYGQAFFPLARPVGLRAGDRVEVDLAVRTRGAVTWSWTSRFQRADRPALAFEQSTFHGTLLTAARIRSRSADHVPRLSRDGEVARWVLAAVDGRRTLGEIAAGLRERFPERFEARQAMQVVCDLCEVHGSRRPVEIFGAGRDAATAAGGTQDGEPVSEGER